MIVHWLTCSLLNELRNLEMTYNKKKTEIKMKFIRKYTCCCMQTSLFSWNKYLTQSGRRVFFSSHRDIDHLKILILNKIVPNFILPFQNSCIMLYPSASIHLSTFSFPDHLSYTRLANRWEILIFPRTAGNTGNSREILVIPGIYWEIGSSPTRKA